MAKGSKDRSLEQTPTWAVAVVCFVLVLISIIIEYILHLIGKVKLCTHMKPLSSGLAGFFNHALN